MPPQSEKIPQTPEGRCLLPLLSHLDQRGAPRSWIWNQILWERRWHGWTSTTHPRWNGVLLDLAPKHTDSYTFSPLSSRPLTLITSMPLMLMAQPSSSVLPGVIIGELSCGYQWMSQSWDFSRLPSIQTPLCMILIQKASVEEGWSLSAWSQCVGGKSPTMDCWGLGARYLPIASAFEIAYYLCYLFILCTEKACVMTGMRKTSCLWFM